MGSNRTSGTSRTGLLAAALTAALAVTTGSVAMPCMLPMPAAGIIPQSVPTVPTVPAGLTWPAGHLTARSGPAAPSVNL